MNTVGAGGEGNIQPIVHHDTSLRTSRQIANPAYEFEEFPGGQILFADLDHVDAFTHRPVSKSDDVAFVPVGDIVANHSVVLVRPTILKDFQKRASSVSPSATSTTPSPETAPRTKLLRKIPRRYME